MTRRYPNRTKLSPLKALLQRFPHACGAMVSGEFHSNELQVAENEGCMVLRKPLNPAQLHAVPPPRTGSATALGMLITLKFLLRLAGPPDQGTDLHFR